MVKILDFINGKKTYIIAILGAAAGASQALGYEVPDYVWTLLGAAGLGAVRHAVGK